MESLTYIKNVKVTPKKLRMIADVVKKSSPHEVSEQLLYTQKKAAKILYKAIQSSITNAKQKLKVSDDLLQFQSLIIEEGQKLKRYRAGSRGSAKPFVRRYSHIKIVLKAKKDKELKTTSRKQEAILPKIESQVKTLSKPVKTDTNNSKPKIAKSKVTKKSKK